MELKGSKTEQNLLASFAGESMARSRYTFYGQAARREGYEQIAELFDLTAYNESIHAQRVLQFLDGIGDTAKNLEAAAFGEHEEWSKIYKEAAEVAAQEGFAEIAAYFKKVSDVEAEHEKRFLKLLNKVKTNTVFKEQSSTQWICKNCGYVHEGTEAPGVCPVCKKPQAFFERKAENY